MKPRLFIRTKAKLLTVLFVASLIAVVGTTGMLPTPKAEAYPWSPNVTLKGTVSVGSPGNSAPTWMWIEASNGERGWATLSGSSLLSKSYSFNFRNVPRGSSIKVTVKAGNSSFSGSTTYYLSRPSTSGVATKNFWL